MPDLRKHHVQPGEPLSAAKFNAALDAIAALLDITAGPDVFISQIGSRRIVELRSKKSAVSSKIEHRWKLTARISGDTATLSWGRGLLAGLPATIGGTVAYEKTRDGQTPTLTITRADLRPSATSGTLECHAYIRLQLSTAFVPESATIITSATRPRVEPFVAHKLLATVADTGGKLTAHPAVFHDLGFWPSRRARNGSFRPWFWAL